MSWKTSLSKRLGEAAKTLGASVGFLRKTMGATVTDAQVDGAVKKADELTDRLEALLVEYIDDIPGVPNILAKLAAEQALRVIDAAIAGAGEAVKARN